jgi:dephospho-CoA kinase
LIFAAYDYEIGGTEDSMKIIGITGGTGAGKTTALGILNEMGCETIDCDAVYHALLENDAELRAALTERFGDVLTDGAVDRKKLGAIVFRDEAALLDLNRISHKFVDREVKRILRAAKERGCTCAAIDAIALIESGLSGRCHAVVGILAPVEHRVRRIMEREGIDESYARMRVEAQKKDSFFREHCDYILENNGEEAAFQAAARALFQKLLS